MNLLKAEACRNIVLTSAAGEPGRLWRCVAVAAGLVLPVFAVLAQSPLSFAGKVVDAASRPQPNARVTLHGASTQNVVVQTDASGSFRLSTAKTGTFTILAETATHQHGELQVSDAAESLRIVVKPAEPAMEFADKPDFAVAGITDWTAVGGHGSDTVLRTSEDLARDTALRARATDAAPKVNGPQEAALRKTVVAHPESYQANHELGEFYLQANEAGRASDLLERAAALHDHAAADEYQAALACRGKGDLARARQHAQLALSKNDAPEYHRLAGELDEQLGEPVQAVKEEARAAALDPSEPNYFVWGSELLVHRAIWQATEVFSHGVKLHPESARLHMAWGAALFAEAKYDLAADQLCAASDLDPENRETYIVLGKLSLGSPAPAPCVAEKLARFQKQRPKDADANYYEAMLLLKNDPAANRDRALGSLRAAISNNPGFAQAYLQLGILAAADRVTSDAQTDFEQAIAADPSLAEAHYRLAVLYDRTGRAQQAKQEFATHERLAREQAEAVEQERLQIKQFVMEPQDSSRAEAP